MHYAAAVDGFLDYIERNKWALLGHICIIFVLSIWTLNGPTKSSRPASRKVSTTAQKQKTSQQLPAVMSGFAPKTEVKLDPPKDDPMSVEELAKYDGKTEGRPIYVAIKGTIFDVSQKKEMYGPGAGYSVFAGKDASVGLGKSSLKPEDAISDYSKLDDEEMKVLEDWYTYFSKRYNIIGKVVQDSSAAGPQVKG